MSSVPSECDEIRGSVEHLRRLLEGLIVRGLRACGPEELAQLQSSTEHLERIGAGHVGALLARLAMLIQKDDRAAAKALLEAQISVRLLERLLTVRVVRGQYESAIASMEDSEGPGAPDVGDKGGETEGPEDEGDH